MNQRGAKRRAAGLVAGLIERHGESLAREVPDRDDRDRMRRALVELGEEMAARAGRASEPERDPDQVALFDPSAISPAVTLERRSTGDQDRQAV